MKILVVEEDVFLRKALVKLLDSIFSKCQIQEFGTAQSATDAIEAGNHFDLIITDYEMDGHDGIWLINWLRQKKITTPIILMSGGLPTVPAGVKFLQKPFSFDVLEQTLMKMGFIKETQ